MATLVLGAVGAGIGSAFGNPALGFSLGVALAGVLFPPKLEGQSRGKLDDTKITGSAYGTHIPQVFGRGRVGGNIIWGMDLVEKVTKKKGGGKGGGQPATKVYSYSVDMAVLICRGPVSSIRRIWGEDKLLYDATTSPGVPLPSTIDIHYGTEDQLPSSVIEGHLGVGNVPAYRGYCYLVFDSFDLTPWGGRIPVINVEVDATPAYDRFALTSSALLAYWRFEDTPGLLIDSGPNAWNLSGAGAVQLTAGDVGEALDFTTSGNTLQSAIGDQSRLQGTELTVSFRFKYDGAGSNEISFTYTDNTDSNYSFFVGIHPTIGVDAVVSLTAGFQDAGYTFAADSNWHHIAMTYKGGGRHRVYLDGVEVANLAAFAGTMAFAGTGKHLKINDGDYYLDEVEIFDRELTAAEIYTRATKNYVCTVGSILTDLFGQVGLTSTQYNLTAAVDVVDGFIIANRTSVRDAIDTLLRVYQVDLVEIDGVVKAVKRGAAVVATLTEDDLGAREYSDNNATHKVEVKRFPDLELPFALDLNYFTAAKDYESANQRATRLSKVYIDDQVTVNTPLVLTETFARQQAERLLYTQWLEREQFSFTLMPQWSWLAPGDCVSLPVAGGFARVRLISMDLTLFGELPCQAVLDEIGVLTQTVTGGSVVDSDQERGQSYNTVLRAWSPNALRDEDADSAGFYAGVAGDTDGGSWAGCVLMMSRDSGATYQSVTDIIDPSTIGIAQTILAAPAAGVNTSMFDRANTVDVLVQYGTANPPTSMSELEVLNGGNVALIGDEVIQFVTATALGSNVYRLSNLLRGRRGTDPYWGTHLVNDRVVLLDNEGATKRVDVSDTLIGKTVQLKAVTLGQEIGDVSPVSLTITGNEFKPYAGANLKGTRDGSSNLTIDWDRRTRFDGAWRDFVDAGLADLPEAYQIDVMNGVTVVRTISVSTSTAAYSAADQTTDFGSPQASVTVNVYQIGVLGRGYVLTGAI